MIWRKRRGAGKPGRFAVAGPALVMVIVLALPALEASGALAPLNDLLALGQGTGQQPAQVATVRRAEPPQVATPRAQCGPGSTPEPGIQGRVPAGSATGGLSCSVSLVAHQGTSGGFKVLRYVDPAGHECAFYDTALLFPVNALKLDGTSLGVAVLDMSDPAHPVQTATLTDPAMMSPHESLNLNPARGLLAAVLGNPSTYPGLVSIYDVRHDCRHPVLQSSKPVARLGHESGFSPDGKTFYATGTAVKSITAVDVTDPKFPHAVWQGNIVAHGMTLSDDGNRAYVADPTGGDMLILDVSQIQARAANPQAREVSRLTWKSASIPQNAIPFTDHGHPYVLEFDEYTQGTTGAGDRNAVGAARIIDIADERAPRVIADLRLQVDQPADHAAASGDPGAGSPVQGYAAHYCNLDSRVDPTVVACSFIASGLRVFDISDLLHPKEIAYYVAPTQPRAENEFMASDFAMSQPAIVPARREIWYSDGATGFYVLRVSPAAWPGAANVQAGAGPVARRGCLARRESVGRRGVGRVRLGMKRKGLARRLPAPRRRTAHSWRWCVKGGGTVSTAFTKSRVVLVATTARGHRLGKLAPGRRARGRGIVRATPRSRQILGVRGGRVRYVAVTSRRAIHRPALLRSYLRAAGLRLRR
jgi:LVIVD repeat